MSDSGLTKVTLRTAEVRKQVALSAPAAALLRDGLTPRQVVELLRDRGHGADAVRFLAAALPRREMVWWACLCLRVGAGPEPGPAVRAALEAAEKWAAHPTDEHRRACYAAGEAAEFGTPAGCAALAAFFSEGSIGPPGVAAIPPKEWLAARMAASSIVLATVLQGPAGAAERLGQFLTLGLEVGNGEKLWAGAAQAASALAAPPTGAAAPPAPRVPGALPRPSPAAAPLPGRVPRPPAPPHPRR